MTYQPTPEMLARVDRLSSYGGIVRGQWQGKDEQGREIACWLGALDPAIDHATACPATVMPPWLARLTPSLDDCVSDAAWPGLWSRYRALLRRWHVLDDAAWRRCELRTRDAALEVAARYDTAGVVAPVRALIARELAGDEPTADEWAAAARKAAGAAGQAAWAAARAAAWAAWAAAEAAWAAKAAARAAALDRIADSCLAAIEAECDAAERAALEDKT